MAEQYETLNGGNWTGSSGKEWFEIRNPADRSEIVGFVPDMGKEDTDRALQAASEGFALWRATSLVDRAAILSRTATLLRQRCEEIARIVTLEMGKTIRDSRQEVAKAADFFDYYASFARFPIGQLLADARPGVEVQVVREPVGTVLAITPWNDPVITPARKLAPALLAGNSVILKPAPESPLAAIYLARALDDAGLPPGVLNVVTGSDDRVGQLLVESLAYDALTFTGSNQVGERLGEVLAPSHIRLQTEMGGKNCVVVRSTARFDAAVEAVVSGAFVQAGQRCTATSRVIVEDSIYESFVAALVEKTSNLRVGPGRIEATDVGPLVSAGRLESVLNVVEQSRDNGSAVQTGGVALTAGLCERGNFMGPTVISNVASDSAVWRDELFAPVVSIAASQSLEDAIQRVNESNFGLSAAIFTQDLTEAAQFGKSVDAGCISVNLPTAGWDVHVPFGGVKASGSAHKEQGVQGLEFYSRWKTLAVRTFTA